MAKLLDAAFGREGYLGGNQNYGAAESHVHWIRAQGKEGDLQCSYIKFQLAPNHVAALAAGVDATLVLEQYDIEKGVGESGTITAHTMPSDWDCSTVTFSNAPAPTGELGSAEGADGPGQVLSVEIPLNAAVLAEAVSDDGIVSICVTSSGSGVILFRSGKAADGARPSLKFPEDAGERVLAALQTNVDAAQEASATADASDLEFTQATLLEEAFGREGYANGTATYGAAKYLDSHRRTLRLNGKMGDHEHTYLKFQLSPEQLESLREGMDARLTLECFETKASRPGDVDVWACDAAWEAETVTFAGEPARTADLGQLGEAVMACDAAALPEMCVIALDSEKLLAATDPDSGVVSLQLASDYVSGLTMFSSSLRPDGKAPELSVQALSDAGRARRAAAAELAKMAAELEAHKIALAQQQAEAALLAANLRMSQMAADEREAAQAAAAAAAEQAAAEAAEAAEQDGWANKPTVVPAEDFDAGADADTLREATKGWGTDEKAIVGVLGRRSNAQRQQIVAAYAAKFSRSLLKDMKSELGGHLEDLVLALLQTPAQFDASNLYKFMSGLGTKAHSLAEVLCTRTGPELCAIKAAYSQMFGKELVDAVRSETAGKFEALLVSLLETERPAGVDPAQAKEDAARLVKTSEDAFFGGNADVWTEILTQRSRRHLRAVFEIFNQEADYDIEEAARRAFSGITQLGRKDYRYAILILVQSARNPAKYYAGRILEAMKGIGTSHDKLTRVVVARAEIDLLDVIAVFPEVSGGKNLHKWISGDVSGHYKNLLLTLVGQ